jgi:osmotically-inducible protein OsmY
MTRCSHKAVPGLLICVLWLTIAACGVKSTGETLGDATLTARVKTAILNDPSVGGLRIDVDTVRGVVTLKGTVRSESQVQIATQLARSVEGVRDVKSALIVQPEDR